jgi:hypothetical protein
MPTLPPPTLLPPLLPPPPTLPLPPTESWVFPLQLPSASILMPLLEKTRCPAAGCNSTRIRVDCRRRFCKSHCILAGGCASPAHFVSAETTCRWPLPGAMSTPFNPLPSQAHQDLSAATQQPQVPIDPCLLEISSTAQSTSATLPSTSTNLPLSGSLDARPNPRFASNMSAIFTEQWKDEQSLREKQRKKHEARLDNIQKSKHNIFVYAWLRVSLLNHYRQGNDSAPMSRMMPSQISWNFKTVTPGHILLSAARSLMTSNLTRT